MVEAGRVVAWGRNDYGQCDVPPGLVATQVAGGVGHSLALCEDGSVVAWGRNYYGQCNVPAGLVATQIAAAYYHSLAIYLIGSSRSRRRRAAWMDLEKPKTLF